MNKYRTLTLLLAALPLAALPYEPATVAGHTIELTSDYNCPDLLPGLTNTAISDAKGFSYTMMVYGGDAYLGWLGYDAAPTTPSLRQLHYNGTGFEISDIPMVIDDPQASSHIKTIFYLGNDTEGTPYVSLQEMPADGSSPAEEAAIYTLSVAETEVCTARKFNLAATGGQTRQLSVHGSLDDGTFSAAAPVWAGIWDDAGLTDEIRIALWQFEDGSGTGLTLSNKFTGRPHLSVQALGQDYVLLDPRGFGTQKPSQPDPRVYALPSSGRLDMYSDLWLPSLSQPDVASGSTIFSVGDNWFIIFPTGTSSKRTYTIASLPDYPYSLSDAAPLWTLKEEFPSYESSSVTFTHGGGIMDTSFVSVVPEDDNTVGLYILTSMTGLAKYTISDRSSVQTSAPQIAVNPEAASFYTLTGMTARLPLAPGVYIRRGQGSSSKILVR